MKNKAIICIGILIIFCTLAPFLFMGNYDLCHTFRRYPWYRANQWYCADIDMTLEYITDTDRNLIERLPSILRVIGQLYQVEVGFYYGGAGVSFLTDENEDDIGESILEGEWKYRRGNLVIQILEESIFDGQYAELVFVPCDD